MLGCVKNTSGHEATTMIFLSLYFSFKLSNTSCLLGQCLSKKYWNEVGLK
jgi:hypothetical protein